MIAALLWMSGFWVTLGVVFDFKSGTSKDIAMIAFFWPLVLGCWIYTRVK